MRRPSQRYLVIIIFDSESSGRQPETFELKELGVALHGQSFRQRDVADNLIPAYPAPIAGTFNTGVLHTALCGMGGHATYGSEPPRHNRTFLVKRLAYRIQELAYGGLSARTVKRLDALAEEEEARITGKPRRRHSDRLLAGTRLVREWDGVEHSVTVLTDGFEWQGRHYRSLSAIARAITGTRWNGPLFFGLRSGAR